MGWWVSKAEDSRLGRAVALKLPARAAFQEPGVLPPGGAQTTWKLYGVSAFGVVRIYQQRIRQVVDGAGEAV